MPKKTVREILCDVFETGFDQDEPLTEVVDAAVADIHKLLERELPKPQVSNLLTLFEKAGWNICAKEMLQRLKKLCEQG